MTALKSMDPESIPDIQRQGRSKFSDEDVAQAIEMLQRGEAVTPDQTFDTQIHARRWAIKLKTRCEQEGEFNHALRPSSRTFKDEEGNWCCAVYLREKWAHEKDAA